MVQQKLGSLRQMRQCQHFNIYCSFINKISTLNVETRPKLIKSFAKLAALI